MSEERVSEAVLGGFVRSRRGRYRPRHWFWPDLWALLLAVFGPALLVVVVLLVASLISWLADAL